MENEDVDFIWEELKDMGIEQIRGLRISPPLDLAWVIYVLVNKIKRLEEQ